MRIVTKILSRLTVSLALVGLVIPSLPQTAFATVDPGLAVHWPLDEGSGITAADTSGHGNDGTIFNGALYVPGQVGTAIHLDGINQYIQTTNPVDVTGAVDEPYALSAWVKLDSGVTQGNIVHISSDISGSGWCIPFLRFNGGVFQAVSWSAHAPFGEVDAVGATHPVAGQWYQVMTTWDPTNGLRLFVNGTLEASTPQDIFSASGGPVYVSFGLGAGGCSGDQGFLKGSVDDLRIYNRVLDTSDVQNIAALDDNDGVSAAIEDAAPHTGDANGDGTLDSEQPNVASFQNSLTHTYNTLAADNACSVSAITTTNPATNSVKDSGFSYPYGMMDFRLDCGTPGHQATVTQYYFGASGSYTLRKYTPAANAYTTVPGATFASVTIGGQAAVAVTYHIADGGPFDADGTANGTIVDPAGLGVVAVTAPHTGGSSR